MTTTKKVYVALNHKEKKFHIGLTSEQYASKAFFKNCIRKGVSSKNFAVYDIGDYDEFEFLFPNLTKRYIELTNALKTLEVINCEKEFYDIEIYELLDPFFKDMFRLGVFDYEYYFEDNVNYSMVFNSKRRFETMGAYEDEEEKGE